MVYFNGAPIGRATSIDFGHVADAVERTLPAVASMTCSFTAANEATRRWLRALFWTKRHHFLRAQAKRKGKPGWKHMRVRYGCR